MVFRRRTAALAASLGVLSGSAALAQSPAQKPVPHPTDLTKGNNLYVIPYAHLDTQWRWTYPQVIREFIANTMHDNFKLIDSYPNYIFNFSGSRRYEMMREYFPADYAKVKQYVKEGRWFPCGSSVDEGDANVPSAESLVRHTLYGNRFFDREFGLHSQEFMLPDCFGFPYALPTVLAHSGVIGFSTQKLTWGSAVGIPFKVGTWLGPDGKSVTAALDPGAYNGSVREDLSQNTSWLARIQNTGKKSGAYVDYHYYGTGDRGGAPDEKSVASVEAAITHGKGPVKVISAKSDEMFLLLKPSQKAKLPTYQGELLLTEHSAGSITSQAYMKRFNRKSELLADAAERASVAAAWLGGAKYPAKRLYDAWDLVLGSQMHDMLPGTSLPKAYEYCWNDFLLAQNQFAAVEQDATGVIASALDTRVQGTPVVVYNPIAIARQDVVEATVASATGNVTVFGPDGKEVPTQVLQNKDGKARILFLAQLPSTGYSVFDAREGQAPATGELNVTANTVENARFRVTVNEAGDIASIYDKANNKEALKSPTRLDFQFHNPSAFPAWNMDWDDAQKAPYGHVEGPAKITVAENGPVRVALAVERTSNGSHYTQYIRLSAGSAGDRVEVANVIDWQTQKTALKAAFPLATGNPKATYELQVGTIERGNNDPKKYEVPSHQWFDLTATDGKYGVGILNDSKFGSDKPDDDTVRLTMLYTPGVRGGYEDQATQDVGRHDILFALAPHAGDWRQGAVPWEARRLNQPLRSFVTTAHAGKLGKSFSLLSVSNPQVEVTAVKKAEDNDNIVIRLRELYGKPAKVQVKFAAPIVAATEVTGQERKLGPATVTAGVLNTELTAYTLKAFSVRLAPAGAKVAPATSIPVALPFDTDVASTDNNRADGAFDTAGRTLAAEQLPATVAAGEVSFKLGATTDGAKNALTAKGQTIALPAGATRVYLLAASSEGDVPTSVTIGTKSVPVTVQDWGGYVGQWDNRLWVEPLRPETEDGQSTCNGLVPGYVKASQVAWFSSHRHNATLGNEYYRYSYLYKYGFDVPAGASSITLPNDARVKVMAVSATTGAHDTTVAAAPLYDTLADHAAVAQAPTIEAPAGAHNDITYVQVGHPLYWGMNKIHYTLDGSTPGSSSPVVSGPIALSATATVKAAMVDEAGNVGEIATNTVEVNDTTAPQVTYARGFAASSQVAVRFSEPVNKTDAANPANYQIEGGPKAKSVTVSPDGMSATVALDQPITLGQPVKLTVAGIADLSPNANKVAPVAYDISANAAVFTTGDETFTSFKRIQVPGLPVKAKDAWTLSFFVKPSAMPNDLTLIAGFGKAKAGGSGMGRYLSKFTAGVNFWADNGDVGSETPLVVGEWQMLTATYDGDVARVYVNGKLVAEGATNLSSDLSEVNILPVDAWGNENRMEGAVRGLTIWKDPLPGDAIQALWAARRLP